MKLLGRHTKFIGKPMPKIIRTVTGILCKLQKIERLVKIFRDIGRNVAKVFGLLLISCGIACQKQYDFGQKMGNQRVIMRSLLGGFFIMLPISSCRSIGKAASLIA